MVTPDDDLCNRPADSSIGDVHLASDENSVSAALASERLMNKRWVSIPKNDHV
jgi:hypothetical protein